MRWSLNVSDFEDIQVLPNSGKSKTLPNVMRESVFNACRKAVLGVESKTTNLKCDQPYFTLI